MGTRPYRPSTKSSSSSRVPVELLRFSTFIGLTYFWDQKCVKATGGCDRAIRHLPQGENRKGHWRNKHQNLLTDLNSMTLRDLPPSHLVCGENPFQRLFRIEAFVLEDLCVLNPPPLFDHGKSSKNAMINAMLFASAQSLVGVGAIGVHRPSLTTIFDVVCVIARPCSN